jgi:hypothetical protein
MVKEYGDNEGIKLMISQGRLIIEASSFCVDYLIKGLDKESLAKMLHIHHGCKNFYLFSLIYICAWPVYFKVVFILHELVSIR